jgi:hypothetical protein
MLVATFQDHEHDMSLTLEQERVMGATLTARMGTTQCLLLGRSPTPYRSRAKLV